MALINPKCIGEPELCSRCTNIRETRHNYSQLTESEKGEIQTPAIPNATRNCVKHNSAENVSQDFVHPTKSDIEASASLILNQKKGRKLQKLQVYLHLHLHIHLHLHWRESRNSPTLQDPESQRERTLEGQPVHLVTFTCK